MRGCIKTRHFGVNFFGAFYGLFTGLSLLPSLALADEASTTTYIPDPSTYVGPVSAGRGGATVASVLIHDAVFQNPASAAFTEKYAVSAGLHGTGNALTASVVDTQTGSLGGALFYTTRNLNSSGLRQVRLAPGNFDRTDTMFGLSFMGKLAPDLGVGVSAKSVGGKSANFDLGLRYKAFDILSFGFLGQNLMDDKKGLTAKLGTLGFELNFASNFFLSAQASLYMGASTGDAIQMPAADARKNVFAAGAEYVFSNSFALRLGYNANQIWHEDYVSAGLGYETPTFAFNYSYQIGTTVRKFQLHGLVATVYF